jgi:hypothetical protein
MVNEGVNLGVIRAILWAVSVSLFGVVLMPLDPQHGTEIARRIAWIDSPDCANSEAQGWREQGY